MSDIKNIAWLAGLIEGEGCVIASAHPGKRKTLRLAIEMTDLDVLEKAKSIIGKWAHIVQRNPPSVNPNHRDRYVLTVSGQPMMEWLMTCYTMFGERRQKAVRGAVRLWKTMNTYDRYSTKKERVAASIRRRIGIKKCAVCNKSFLPKKRSRVTLCGGQSCASEWGRICAMRRYHYEFVR